MSGDAIGMMEGAFFVGRGELLSWINEFFGLSLTKVEQCATGAVYCQIIDAIFPGTVPMAKVKWQAKHDYEYVENYKVLQQAFAKNEIKRYIDVDKLVKAKYQDNLEMLQWLKRYFDINYNGEPYDAAGRRKGQDLYYILGGAKVGAAQPSKIGGAKPSGMSKIGGTTVAKPSGGVTGHKPTVGGAAGGAKPTVGKKDDHGHAGSSEEAKKLQSEVQEMKLNMETLEKERDFYFAKLRDIEVLLQANQEQQNGLTENVLKILYASEEEKVQIGDDGKLTITTADGNIKADNTDDLLNDEEEEKLNE